MYMLLNGSDAESILNKKVIELDKQQQFAFNGTIIKADYNKVILEQLLDDGISLLRTIDYFQL